jgi:hypothetical protein
VIDVRSDLAEREASQALIEHNDERHARQVLQLKSTAAGMRSDCSAAPRMLFQQFGSASCATNRASPIKGADR